MGTPPYREPILAYRMSALGKSRYRNGGHTCRIPAQEQSYSIVEGFALSLQALVRIAGLDAQCTFQLSLNDKIRHSSGARVSRAGFAEPARA